MAGEEAQMTDCSIEACRTCGVFFLTTSNFLRQIFAEDPEINLIRVELAAWNVEINENDGFPQFICTGCMHDFQKVFKFRRSCIEMQQQLRHFYNLRQTNASMVQVKTELPDPDEAEGILCDFIYVDDLDDGDYDDATTPFIIPHVPIKDELIEEATVPAMETSEDARTEAARPNVETTAASTTSKDEQQLEPLPSVVEEPQHLHAVQEVHEVALTTPPAAPLVPRFTQRLHEDIKDLECHLCGKEFKNSTTTRLNFHMKWHKISKHVKCVQCGFFCGTRAAMREHMRAVHASSKCPVCDKRVFAKKLKSHMRGHQQSAEEKRNRIIELACSYCAESFSSESEREQHIWQVHARDDTGSDPNPNVLEISATESPVYEIICSLCAQKFSHHSELEQHWKDTQHSVAPSLVDPTTPPADTENSAEDNSQIKKEKLVTDEEEEESEPLRFNDYDTPPTGSANDDHAVTKTSTSQLDITNGTISFKEDDSATSAADQESFRAFEDEKDDDDEGVSSDTEIRSTVVALSPQLSAAAASVDGATIPQYVCAQCTETFGSIAALYAHRETHFQKPKFSCHICGKSFDLKFSLNRHLKKHKKPPF